MQPGYRASSIVVRMLIIMQRDENDRVHIKRKRAICAFNSTVGKAVNMLRFVANLSTSCLPLTDSLHTGRCNQSL